MAGLASEGPVSPGVGPMRGSPGGSSGVMVHGGGVGCHRSWCSSCLLLGGGPLESSGPRRRRPRSTTLLRPPLAFATSTTVPASSSFTGWIHPCLNRSIPIALLLKKRQIYSYFFSFGNPSQESLAVILAGERCIPIFRIPLRKYELWYWICFFLYHRQYEVYALCATHQTQSYW
jgi:hypothetical protein